MQSAGLLKMKRYIYELRQRLFYLSILNRTPDGGIVYASFFYQKNKIDNLLILVDCIINKKEFGVKLFFFLRKENKIKVIVKYKKKNRITLKNYVLSRPDVDGFSLYNPEIYQFGGYAGWRIAEEYFYNQSMFILQITGSRKIANEVCILLTLDILLRTTNDSWEAWDVCMRLRSVRGKNEKKKDEFEKTLDKILDKKNEFTKTLLDSTGGLQKALQNNSGLSDDLVNAVNSGILDFGLRQILPSYILYLWNEFDISNDDQRALINGLLIRLNKLKTP